VVPSVPMMSVLYFNLSRGCILGSSGIRKLGYLLSVGTLDDLLNDEKRGASTYG